MIGGLSLLLMAGQHTAANTTSSLLTCGAALKLAATPDSVTDVQLSEPRQVRPHSQCHCGCTGLHTVTLPFSFHPIFWFKWPFSFLEFYILTGFTREPPGIIDYSQFLQID